LDLQSKRGVGLATDYRYIRRLGSEGNTHFYSIYDKELEKFRGEFTARHQEIVSPDFNIKADINAVSDRDFFRNFSESFGSYNRQTLESTLSATKKWDRSLLVTEFEYTKDLNLGADNSATLQRLPTVDFTVVQRRVGATPLYLSFDSTFDNFYRQIGRRGLRADLHPVASLNMPLGPVLETSIWGGYRGRFYYLYDNGFNEQDRNRDDFIPDAGARVTTTIDRVYDLGWGPLEKVKHTVIPEVTYSYRPESGRAGLPFFDFHDDPVRENLINYSLTNFLTGKIVTGNEPPYYRELFFLKVSQGYELEGTRRDLLTIVDEGRPATDLRIEARVSPLRPLTLSTDTRYNTYVSRISTLGVAAALQSVAGNSASVEYRFARGTHIDGEGNQGPEEKLSYLQGQFSLALLKPFYLNYTARYSLDDNQPQSDTNHFLEQQYAVEYRHQCWSVNVTYHERPGFLDRAGDRSFLVNFTLSGIGSMLPFSAF
jgi:LPS-assembly protein